MRRFVEVFLKEEDLLQLHNLLAPLQPVTDRITLLTFPMTVAVLVDMQVISVMRTNGKIAMYNFKRRTAEMLLFSQVCIHKIHITIALTLCITL